MVFVPGKIAHGEMIAKSVERDAWRVERSIVNRGSWIVNRYHLIFPGIASLAISAQGPKGVAGGDGGETMFWRILMIGAACVALLQGVGCENMDKIGAFFTVESESSPNDRVINAPLDQVSVKTQTTMSSLALASTLNRQGDEIRLSAKNSNGAKITVILTAVKGKDSEQTKAHIDWEGGRDDQTGFLILNSLQAVGRP